MTKKGPTKSFQTNDRIFAKVKGYPAWPACVTGPIDAKGTKYKVYFYGTYETANVSVKEMWYFDESTKAKFGKQKRKGFAEAIDEIENKPEVGYLTEEILPILSEKEPLEGGTGGDTILEESGLDISNAVDETKVKIETPAPVDEKVEAAPSPLPAPLPTKTNANVSAKKGAKRKANASDSPALTPVAKQAKMSTPLAKSKTSTPVAASTPLNGTPVTAAPAASEEKISRSGRVIKQKKFQDEKDSPNQKATMVDEEDGNMIVTSPNMKSLIGKKNDRKMWIQIKATSDSIEINMDKDKPNFESQVEEVEWDRETAKNALRFKKLVETGQYIPNEILKKLESKINRTPEEEDILKHNIELSNIKEKMRWMKLEKKIVDLDIAIRSALHHEEPDMARCISLISELQSLAIQPLMLKKLPNIVMTLRKVRKYIGPIKPHPDPKVTEEQKEDMQKIRLDAEAAYKKIQSLFSTPSDVSFSKFFQKQVEEFQVATKDCEREDVLQMLVDPTNV